MKSTSLMSSLLRARSAARAGAAGLLVLALGVSSASASLLGTAGQYGEFILGNSTRSNVDAQGKVAVGGIVNFNNFTVASQQATNTTNLVVGGTLSANSASVKGHIVTGGNATYTTPTVNGNFSSNGSLTFGSGGTVNGNVRYGTTFNQNGATISGTITGPVATPVPVDFAAEGAYLTALSAAQVNPADPTPTFQFSQMFITAGAGANYYNLTGAQIAGSPGGFNISAPAGATVILNVSGSGFTIPNTGFNLSGGITVANLLWNFYDATSFTIQGSAAGTFLAPKAAISTSFGGFNGNLIAASLTGSIETHTMNGGGGVPTFFDGPLRPIPVPEPATAGLLSIAAVAGVALLRRRRAA
ncbi:choice-of-anchor A family protein [Lacipirellula sp.]|uniref:choice-of-anchor A family protein n=1 Tax=Lacipirellula sp. TaxID=2691419 RepID=UPI003D0F9ECC